MNLKHFFLFSFILINSLLFSCKDESSKTVSEEEAVEVITNSMAAKTGGTEQQTANIADIWATLGNYCNTTFDTSLVKNITLTNLTANYTLDYDYTITCNILGLPTSANLNAATSGTYNTTRISSNDSTTSAYILSDLLNLTQYTLNGTSTRTGSQVSSIGNDASFSSVVSTTFSNVKINLTTGIIDSGTATVSISGTTTDNQNYNYTGSIVFLGNQTATLTLNGNTHNLTW
jgi:hypothetical protein